VDGVPGHSELTAGRPGTDRGASADPGRAATTLPVMTADGPPDPGSAAAAAYADRFAAETLELAEARVRALGLPGAPPVEPAVGAALALLAHQVAARAVVSIGSGGGVAGLWLMQGMRPDGVLTALDAEPDQLRAARAAYADARVPPGRTRLIFGTPAEVLPRLSPGAYDMVCCAGPPLEYGRHLPALLDLVRTRGTITFHGVLAGGRVADRTARDPRTVAWRELARAIREDESLLSVVLPVGAGLLVATKKD
jgi:predicted O-methyltransferase YrrM